MISVQEAERIILQLAQSLPQIEQVDLKAAVGRVLASNIISKMDYPLWDNSAMDGYAIKYADVTNTPSHLEVIEEIKAGISPQKTIQTAQAARIFTGGMLPEGADTVIMQENTTVTGQKVSILSPPKHLGEFVRKKGAFCLADSLLLSQGTLINPPEIAILANAQLTTIPVYPLVKVAILSTGDELLPPEEVLTPGKIVDSNQRALSSFIQQMGGIPLELGIIGDSLQQLQESVEKASLQANVILSTGGVSVGDYDYVKAVLHNLGATIHLQSVAIKPGKPLTVATLPNGCLYFGIPGNPVSALVSCWRFVKGALKKLSGQTQDWYPSVVKAILLQELRSDGKRESYIWGKVSLIDGDYQFTPATGAHNSGNLINLAGTNALAMLRVGEGVISEGETVMVMLVN